MNNVGGVVLGGFVVFYGDANRFAGVDEDDQLFVYFTPMLYEANNNKIPVVFERV